MGAYQTLNDKVKESKITLFALGLATGLTFLVDNYQPAHAADAGFTNNDGETQGINIGTPGGSSTVGVVDGQTVLFPGGETIGHTANGQIIIRPGYVSPEVQAEQERNQTQNNTYKLGNNWMIEEYNRQAQQELDLSKRIKIYKEGEKEIDANKNKYSQEQVEKFFIDYAVTLRNNKDRKGASQIYKKLDGLYSGRGHDIAAKNVLKTR